MAISSRTRGQWSETLHRAGLFVGDDELLDAARRRVARLPVDDGEHTALADERQVPRRSVAELGPLHEAGEALGPEPRPVGLIGPLQDGRVVDRAARLRRPAMLLPAGRQRRQIERLGDRLAGAGGLVVVAMRRDAAPSQPLGVRAALALTGADHAGA